MKKIATLLAMLPLLLFGSNIEVTNVQATPNTSTNQAVITFDLSWDNGWRIAGGTEFMDGAWVFIKYRTMAMPEWKHGMVSSSNIVSGILDIEADPRQLGVKFKPSADTVGTISGSVEITIGNLLSTPYGLEVQVHAVEMVKIPSSPYYVGDYGQYSWHQYGSNNDEPYHVTQSDTIYRTQGGIDHLNNSSVPYVVASTEEFWVMKYEVSQDQFVSFLNSLSRTQQDNAVPLDLSTSSNNVFALSETATPSFRNGIRIDAGFDTVSGPLTFYCDLNNNSVANENTDGLNIACNYLSPDQLYGYLHWAGLQAMTEFDYEKCSRGPLFPNADEFAWGTSDIAPIDFTSSSMLQNSGAPNETVQVKMNYRTHLYINTSSPFTGPIRCGALAESNTTTRIGASASYYGLQDLTGNVGEYVLIQYGYAEILGVTFNPDTLNGEHGFNFNARDYSLVKGGSNIYALSSTATVSICVSATTNDIPVYMNGGRGRL